MEKPFVSLLSMMRFRFLDSALFFLGFSHSSLSVLSLLFSVALRGKSLSTPICEQHQHMAVNHEIHTRPRRLRSRSARRLREAGVRMLLTSSAGFSILITAGIIGVLAIETFRFFTVEFQSPS